MGQIKNRFHLREGDNVKKVVLPTEPCFRGGAGYRGGV